MQITTKSYTTDIYFSSSNDTHYAMVHIKISPTSPEKSPIFVGLSLSELCTEISEFLLTNPKAAEGSHVLQAMLNEAQEQKSYQHPQLQFKVGMDYLTFKEHTGGRNEED